MIRILLADDHDLMREGIRSMLESHSNFEVCAEAKDGIEAAEKALEYRPDVVILDVTMPKMNGLEASRRITKQLPETQVLIFTIHDSEDMVRETLDAGAHGYVLKSEAPTHLAAAVEAVAQRDLYFSSGISNFVIDSLVNSGGGTIEGSIQEIPLTAREIEVLKLLARGNSNKEIATTLFISVRTVETHRRTIHKKLKLNSVAELVRYAIRLRLIKP
ncbi:MAG TPA: response regulator transcription factor [Pyrinomonadaceae bacterium]|nr:response regulator transcription factor [Pyrinomonadaceae bacterium]